MNMAYLYQLLVAMLLVAFQIYSIRKRIFILENRIDKLEKTVDECLLLRLDEFTSWEQRRTVKGNLALTTTTLEFAHEDKINHAGERHAPHHNPALHVRGKVGGGK